MDADVFSWLVGTIKKKKKSITLPTGATVQIWEADVFGMFDVWVKDLQGCLDQALCKTV